MSGDVRDRAGFTFRAGREIKSFFFPITLVLDLLYSDQKKHTSILGW